MTVAVAASRASYAGDGTSKNFAGAFRANSAAEVGVSVVDNTTKVAVVPVLNTDYTVTFAAGNLPTVVFGTAPAAGKTVLVYAKNSVKQETNLDAADPLFASALVAAIDKIAAQLQALEDKVNSSVRYPEQDVQPAAIASAPSRFNTFVTFNATGALTLRPLADVGL